MTNFVVEKKNTSELKISSKKCQYTAGTFGTKIRTTDNRNTPNKHCILYPALKISKCIEISYIQCGLKFVTIDVPRLYMCY